MKREELRPVRLQLELLKPQLIMDERGIESTIVMFGGARIPAPDARGRRGRRRWPTCRITTTRRGASPGS